MAVLVTRPGEQGLDLCRALSHSGVQSYHFPLIEIQLEQRLDGLCEQMKAVDIILAVSQHAVAAVDNYLEQKKERWPAKVYFAIGQKTAHVLSMASQQKVHCPNINDSEHLLALPQLNNISNQKALILRGNGGRELIIKPSHNAALAFNTIKSTVVRNWLLMPIDSCLFGKKITFLNWWSQAKSNSNTLSLR